MMRNLAIVAITCFAMFASSGALAVRVNSIYQAELPVASQSPSEKIQAAKTGLEHVLVKVSGDGQIISHNPNLKESIKHADTYTQEFRYTTPHHASKVAPYLLTVHYDPEKINRLLKEAGLAVWGQNRPLILMWLALDTPNHPLDIVDASDIDIQPLVKLSTKTRGIPILLPVMDVNELNQIAVDDVVNKNLEKLQPVSQRYQSNGLLIGHVTSDDEGLNSQWQLLLGGDQWDWNVKGKDLKEVMTGVINNVADTLAERYSVSLNTTSSSSVTLKINGVKHQDDLMQVMKYLQHMNQVADVQLTSVEGNDVILNINLRSNRQSFTQAVALGKNLIPDTTASVAEDTLVYTWTK